MDLSVDADALLVVLSLSSAVELAQKSLVCTTWRNAAYSNALWKPLFKKQWNDWNSYPDLIKDGLPEVFDSWRAIFAARMDLRNWVRAKVRQLQWPSDRINILRSLVYLAQGHIPPPPHQLDMSWVRAVEGRFLRLWCTWEMTALASSDEHEEIGLRYFARAALRPMVLERSRKELVSLLDIPGATEVGEGVISENSTRLEAGACLLGAAVEALQLLDSNYTLPISPMILEGGSALSRALDTIGWEAARRIRLRNEDALTEGASDDRKIVNLEILNQLLFGEPIPSENILNEESPQDILKEGFQCPQTGGLGIKGNQLDYYDPLNSNIQEVLRTRKGIPITLAILQQAVGARCGVDIKMAGIPGHFLTAMKTSNPENDRYSDNFNGGHLLTREDVVSEFLVPMGVPARAIEQVMEDTPDTDVMFRVLNNLVVVYKQRIVRSGSATFNGVIVALKRMLISLKHSSMSMEEFVGTQAHFYSGLVLNNEEEVRDWARGEEGMVLTMGDIQSHPPVLHLHAGVFESTQPQIRTRSDPDYPAFSVGSIVSPRHFSQNPITARWVVVEWNTPDIPRQDKEWRHRTEEFKKRDERDESTEPFYLVLPHGGIVSDPVTANSLWLPESTLKLVLPHEASPIQHNRLGEFFSAFDPEVGAYIPNEYTSLRYPDDYASHRARSEVNGLRQMLQGASMQTQQTI